jgi:arginyl-tRNA synthetase
VQYAVVRARNIFRKAGTTPQAALAEVQVGSYLEGEEAAGLWELWVMASRMSLLLEQCIAAAEPAYLARHAFQLAQLFNNFYHRHHILTEDDPARRQFLFATAAVAERALVRSLEWLGISVPEVM